MPTILDATVVARADDTSGNGGRKLVQLDNGRMIALLQDTSTTYDDYVIMATDDNWVTEFELARLIDNATVMLSGGTIATDGRYVFVTVPYPLNIRHLSIDGYATAFGSVLVPSSSVISGINRSILDTSQSAIGANSQITNEAKTEIHATWASKISTYPSSFNIRYAKGTINGDGSVTWGAVEQRTTINATNHGSLNPSIIVVDNKPMIIYEEATSIGSIKSMFYNGASWNTSVTVFTNSYRQSSPSAIFVPQSVNGLANGLIADVWDGFDATHTTTSYIRVSKSIDGGVNWSAMQKLVPGINGTLTANKTGKLFITYDDAGTTKRIESTNNGDSWSSAITVGAGTNPSSLFDLTMDMSVPLTIRKGATSVLFSGTWTVTTISVTQGSIGQKTDKANVLTYAITTDGAMSTITEKVNGVTVGTKTATSGQSQIVGLSQAQWDAIVFGKYGTSRNLLPPFREWSRDSSVSVTSSYGMSGTSTVAFPIIASVKVAAKENTTYSFTANKAANGYFIIRHLGADDAVLHSTEGGNNLLGFVTVPGTVALSVVLSTSVASAYSFDSPVLSEGATEIPFEPNIVGNTLTIEMGTETFTYTFDKRPATDADMISVAKAVQDSANVYLPAVKQKFTDKFGGNPTDPFEMLIEGVDLGYAMDSGSAISSSGFVNYQTSSSGLTNLASLTVNSLDFKPSLIYLFTRESLSTTKTTAYYEEMNHAGTVMDGDIVLSTGTSQVSYVKNASPAVVSATGFTLPVFPTNTTFYWVAFGKK